MAKLVTVIQTYFKDGNYRNNRVEIDIPNEAAELIKKMWDEKAVYTCTRAKYLASNQNATVELFQDDELIGGMRNIIQIKTVEDEVFERTCKDCD